MELLEDFRMRVQRDHLNYLEIQNNQLEWLPISKIKINFFNSSNKEANHLIQDSNGYPNYYMAVDLRKEALKLLH